eukprot:TRINITY_DN2598_c0_g1_i1.p1 TRINITY_DN2598_c0_g1~~TRINITY_DN2598_c0_g1_i1.p1  ORF type:complete len:140 (-),score=17.69 TRINITY_DN2598_c0_g1_i1:274-693(-)
MIINPELCALGGGLYWRVCADEQRFNEHFYIQEHTLQPSSGIINSAIGWWRSTVKQDEHANAVFRIIAKRPPYLIIAYGNTLQDVLNDWDFLEAHFFSWSNSQMPYAADPEKLDQIKEKISELRELQLTVSTTSTTFRT